MRIFCTLFIYFTFAACLATAGEADWNTGEVVFSSQSAMHGEVRYDWRADVVQYRQSGRIYTYSTHLLRSFSFFDPQLNAIRYFEAIPGQKGRSARTFYEVIVDGSLKLVRRPNQMVGFGVPVNLMPAEDSDLAFQLSGYTWYVYTEGKLVNMRNFRGKIWPVMKSQFGVEMKKFTDDYGVNPHTLTGKFRLINQYNVLKAIEMNSAISVQAGQH
jgi:hypothetical protein